MSNENVKDITKLLTKKNQFVYDKCFIRKILE